MNRPTIVKEDAARLEYGTQLLHACILHACILHAADGLPGMDSDTLMPAAIALFNGVLAMDAKESRGFAVDALVEAIEGVAENLFTLEQALIKAQRGETE